MDRKDLKIQALLEKISSLTTSYENNAADLRVELTLASQERDQVQQELEGLKNEVAESNNAAEPAKDED
jgi:hypothetical protein